MTEADRLRLAAVDQAVLAEAAAGREQELALRQSDNDRIVQVERLRLQDAGDRRRRRGYVLAGLAVVVVILAIITAIWLISRNQQASDLRRDQIRQRSAQDVERARQQTAQECIRRGNIWTGDGDCLLTNHQPAPTRS